MASRAVIDLRSDTVTRPDAAMRQAMADADVGDDQFGEDPTTNLLQDRIASMLGKEAALFFPTGTMANQVALRVLTRPGDEVVVGTEAHSVWHETGGSAANAGLQFREIGEGGLFGADAFVEAIKPRGHMIFPPTTLVELENTHNRGGGVVFPQQDVIRICEAARAREIATYLDGARLWNAAIASRRSPAELAAPFDLAMVTLSKGLGAPGGSLLAGSAQHIRLALRHRRMLGGAMRQTGHYAAAGLYALEHNLDRLADDHANARVLADRLLRSERVVLDARTVQTNIVVFGLRADGPDAAQVVARARERGLLLVAFGARTVRATTHLQVAREACERAGDILVDVIDA
jgi:threonine aldolase